MAELHLIVLWEKARYREQEIIDDIKNHMTILNAYEITWTPGNVANNFSRFYGQKLESNSFKERECGGGPFLVLVVRDDNPEYKFVETSRGHEIANTTLFSAKERYRGMTRGGHKIHTTNSVTETNHDATLLLGMNYDDLVKNHKTKWDGTIKKIHRDITGCNGWHDLHEFFYTLNATTEYVVLRGFEDMAATVSAADHGDIDIMVTDYDNAVMIVGGEKLYPDHTRHKYEINIGKNKVRIDVFDARNNYEDKNWDKNIFKTSILWDDNVRVPSRENYFYMLVYHCLIHKENVAPDYAMTIKDLFHELKFDKQYDISKYDSPFDLYFELLESFMKKNHYSFVKPNDNNYFYSKKFTELDKVRKYFIDNYRLKDILPVHSDLINDSFNTFLTATDENGTRLFIKYGDTIGLYRNEYNCAKKLYDINTKNFVRPMYYHDDSGTGFFACEYVRGDTLEDVMSEKPSAKLREKLIRDLYDIFIALKSADVVHRDINPKNLIVCNNRLVLIDFQMAVLKSNYVELGFLSHQLHLLAGLGREFARGRFTWDDAYSLLKVLEYIGCDAEYKDLYNSVYQEIKREVGKNCVSFCNAQKLKYAKIKLLVYRLKEKLSFSGKKRKKYRQKRKDLKTVYKLLKEAKEI